MTPDFNGHGNEALGEAGKALHDADSAALDALIEAGFDVSRVPEHSRERAARVAAVLGLLNTPMADVVGSPLLIDATLARVGALRTSGAAGARADATPMLTPDDDDALEMLISAGYRPERVPGSVRARARRHASVLALLETPVQPTDSDTLINATLRRVQSDVDSQRSRLRIEARPAAVRRVRLGDLISVAAVLLLAGSVVIPVLGSMREMSRRSACGANMAQAGLGFGLYANDFKDALPLASASTPGVQWWSVGDKDRSNSANLFTLARTGYRKVGELTCPGNPNACREPSAPGQYDWRSMDQVSFSYQNMFAKERPRWVGPVVITVLADRSPIIPLAMQGRKINPIQNSLQHDGRGQGLLRNDGSVLWLTTPVQNNGDNIYLPRPLEELIARLQAFNEADPLRGTETPAGADDVFLAP